MQKIADGLWICRYPLQVLGTHEGRTVTLVQLRSGEIIIHSTAPFSRAEADAIKELGPPAALIDATLIHDTFVDAARAAFPGVPHLAPQGFRSKARAPSNPILPPPESWKGELDVLLLQGVPRLQEHLFFHRPSKTLIVADLVFNFGPSAPAWTKFFFRVFAGIREYPGMSRLYRMMIKHRATFAESLHRMMQWDFDRLIVGHGEIIEDGAKKKLGAALRRHGLFDDSKTDGSGSTR